MNVLQLDVGMRPVDLIGVQDAIAKIATGRAQALESDLNVLFRGPLHEGREQLVIPRPLVIQVPAYVELKPYATKNVVRRVLYARDRHRCMYCLDPVTVATRTVDHVKPLSRGGGHDWENVCTACRSCNSRKADHLPFEVGMYPAETPKAPTFVQVQFAGRLDPVQAAYVKAYYPKHDIEV